jgi:hypothetical protein
MKNINPVSLGNANAFEVIPKSRVSKGTEKINKRKDQRTVAGNRFFGSRPIAETSFGNRAA